MTHTAHGQQGMALIEALIASAVLGIGLVGATQLTLKTLHIASENRQHTVAQHLVQEAMDCLRTQATRCAGQEEIQVQGVRYTRQARRTPRGNGLLSDLQVSVQWRASGTRSGQSASTPSGTSTHLGAPADQRIEWHSSASELPGWVGVSSP